MGCCDTLDVLRHVTFGIILGTWNLISTCINVSYLYHLGEDFYAALSLFFLWFPGIVTSVGFLVLYLRGNPTVLKLKPWKLVVYPLLLLVFYPVIPIVLTAAHLVTGNEKTLEKATMAKFFAGFLDHGPNFVLRLVIVVLNEISQNGEYSRGDIVFVLSMVSSFCSMVLYGLYFNERESRTVRWIFLCIPMFSAIFACRAFTIAVFLKYTTESGNSGSLLCLFLIAAMFLANFGLFRYCGQDWTRSAVFGITSLLIPAGYNNDKEYYQLPGQNVLMDCHTCRIAPRIRKNRSIDHEDPVQDVPLEQNQLQDVPLEQNQASIYPNLEPIQDMNDQQQPGDHGDMQIPNTEVVDPTTDGQTGLVPMKSGKFLLLHIIVNTGVISCTALYVFTKENNKDSEDALVIPQILGAIPGLLFSIGHSILMPDVCQVYDDNETRVDKACGFCRQGGKVFLSVVFAILGFCSLVPALFWTFIYKFFTSADITKTLLNISET